MPNMDMGGGPPRRRQQQSQQQPPQPQYLPQYHPGMNPMYQNYNPYNAPPYYGVPPQYQNGGIPSPGYMQYQNYSRSPPTMPQYVPMTGVAVPPNNYAHPSPHSPSLSTPYRPPPPPVPMTPHTPSSTQSSHVPPPATPPAKHEHLTTEIAIPASEPVEPPVPVSRIAFQPPVGLMKLFNRIALTDCNSFLGFPAQISNFPREPHVPNDESNNWLRATNLSLSLLNNSLVLWKTNLILCSLLRLLVQRIL